MRFIVDDFVSSVLTTLKTWERVCEARAQAGRLAVAVAVAIIFVVIAILAFQIGGLLLLQQVTVIGLETSVVS